MNDGNRTKRLFICQVIPQQQVAQFKTVSQAAVDFCMALVEGGCFDHTLSLIPINIRPNIKKYCRHPAIDYIQVRLVPQLPGLRYINSVIEIIVLLLKSFFFKEIWFYNINSSTLFPAWILQHIFREKVFILLADYTPASNYFSAQTAMRYVMEKSNGIISLSARSTIRHRNMIALPGVIPQKRLDVKYPFPQNNRKFLFSGVLNPFKGINMALTVFARVPEAELYISGRGSEEQLCKEYAEKYPNIHFFGFLSKTDYNILFSQIAFCLNFRNPAFNENQNNFPSKVMEYFLHQKAVISTIEYPELKGIHYLLETKYDPDTLAESIRRYTRMTETELHRYADNQEQLGRFTEAAWKEQFTQVENNV